MDGWITYLLIGLLAGFIGGKLTKGSGFGMFGNLIIGIIGAGIGKTVLEFFDVSMGYTFPAQLLTATIGSVLLLLILGKIKS